MFIFVLSKNTENMEQELKKIEGVEFLVVELNFNCIIPQDCLNLGSISLECEGRSFVLDIVESKWCEDDNHTLVIISVQTNYDSDSDFDLTASDLMASDLKATIFMEVDENETGNSDLPYSDPESKTLFVRIGDMTKAIDLEFDN